MKIFAIVFFTFCMIIKTTLLFSVDHNNYNKIIKIKKISTMLIRQDKIKGKKCGDKLGLG